MQVFLSLSRDHVSQTFQEGKLEVRHALVCSFQSVGNNLAMQLNAKEELKFGGEQKKVLIAAINSGSSATTTTISYNPVMLLIHHLIGFLLFELDWSQLTNHNCQDKTMLWMKTSMG